MDVEWDPDKAAANLQKHSVDFSDAATVLHDDLALTVLDDSAGEARFVTVGSDALGRLLVVVYVVRDEVIRIISARKATRHERESYEGDS